MTRKGVSDMIAGIGLPYAYYQFAEREAPSGPPFICFYYPRDDDFIADDKNYQPINALIIELYSDNVDFTHEAAIESALQTNGLPYSREQTYIEGERMYQTTYTTEVVIDA